MASEHTERTPAPLRGYRVLSDEEKALVDRIKLCEDEVGKLWAEVHDRCATSHGIRYSLRAETLFRDGFMELVRSVTLPRDAYREHLHRVEFERKGGADNGG